MSSQPSPAAVWVDWRKPYKELLKRRGRKAGGEEGEGGEGGGSNRFTNPAMPILSVITRLDLFPK